ncbi:MAG: flagellar basal body rod protein FlgB [Gammaproteobacteria bacterium]|nr:flagellar basal body rod protein FlgB [Gammaproteobacteria bacterium]
MPFNIDAALGIHPQALALRARRAEVLAANLANSDTPNYKARDIDFRAALSGAVAAQGTNGLTLAATDVAHQPGENGAGVNAALLYRTPMQPSIDGNTVDQHLEYSQFAQNALQYQASLTFLGGRIKTLLTAIRGD